MFPRVTSFQRSLSFLGMGFPPSIGTCSAPVYNAVIHKTFPASPKCPFFILACFPLSFMHHKARPFRRRTLDKQIVIFPFPVVPLQIPNGPHHISSWKSLFANRTSSPGLNGGRPMYGQPSQRNASPSAQDPQLPTFPCTVRSVSRSSAVSIATDGGTDAVLLVADWVPLIADAEARGTPLLSDEVEVVVVVVRLEALLSAKGVRSEDSFASAAFRLARSSAARRAARPQVQSLQARRFRPGRGAHSAAENTDRVVVQQGLVRWMGVTGEEGLGKRQMGRGRKGAGEGAYVVRCSAARNLLR